MRDRRRGRDGGKAGREEGRAIEEEDQREGWMRGRRWRGE